MAMLSPRLLKASASDTGVDSAGVEEASKLLLSVRDATEGLVAEIKSCDGSRCQKWSTADKVAAELQELTSSMFRIWGVLLVADLLSSPEGRALSLQARDATYALGHIEDMVKYPSLRLKLAPPPTKFRKNPLLSRLIGCDGVSSWKPTKFRKRLRFVTLETRKLVHLLAEGAAPSSLIPPLLAYPDPGYLTTEAQLVLTKHTVFGRDKERDKIQQVLLEEPCGQTEPTLISIVGIGGVGKTTLAHLLYNDTNVQQHFDITSWVFVSSSFNRVDLAAEILRSAQPAWTGSADKMLDFKMLQSELQRFVASKRCLIVLDDIWADTNDVTAAWQDILAPLRSAGTRSRILVTTRTNIVPKLLGASHIYHLNPLSIDDTWGLLKKHAFCNDRGDEYPELQPIGRAIASKIHGLPLVAKVVGQMLRPTRSKEQWENIMGALILGDAVSAALRLSYNHLPGHIKRCFAFCSLFPKNWKFDPPHLIRLWTAEGLVQPLGWAQERTEDRARGYFDHLLSCSLFHELKLGSNKYYLMHDLLHDLAQFVAEGDCFRIERTMDFDVPSTVRHLSVTTNNLHDIKSIGNVRNLRSLVVLRSLSFSSSYMEKDLFQKLRNLRILDLSGCNLLELPQSIGNLLHLRYLSVDDTIKQLPGSIGKLLYLQCLCFSENSSLEKLPAATTLLVNLRHLCVETKYIAGLEGIGRLINLQGSLEFQVEKLEGRTLEELRNLNSLSGTLKIKGLENVSSNEEACRAELNKKQYLNSLSLEWGSAYRKLHPPADAEVLEGLEPHQDLKELCIRRYCGTEAPSWLQSSLMQQLQSLHLINCRSLSILPPLGKLGALRTLHMRELCAVVQIDHEFYGADDVAFPSLSVLEFDDFPRLHEWSGIADKKSFPCLRRLTLTDCPALTQFPSLPSTVIEATIERTGLIPYIRVSPLTSSSEMLQLDVCTSSILLKGVLHEKHIKSIVTLNISGAEQLLAPKELGSLVSLKRVQLSRCDFTDQTLNRFLLALPCLSSLEIIDLPNVTSLPVMENLKLCTMIKELCVRNCQLLCSLSSLQFFKSLSYLVIERCPNITAASFPVNFSNLSSLKVLRISYCSELQSLPACGLPSSLETVNFIGCHPELSKAIKKQETPLL